MESAHHTFHAADSCPALTSDLRQQEHESSCAFGDFYPPDNDPDRSVALEADGVFANAVGIGFDIGDAYADRDMAARSAGLDYSFEGMIPLVPFGSGGSETVGCFCWDEALQGGSDDPYTSHRTLKKHQLWNGGVDNEAGPSHSSWALQAAIRPDSALFQYCDSHIALPSQIVPADVMEFALSFFQKLQNIEVKAKHKKLSLKALIVHKNEVVGIKIKLYHELYHEWDRSYILELSRTQGDTCKFLAVYQQLAGDLLKKFPQASSNISVDTPSPPMLAAEFQEDSWDLDPLLSFFDSEYVEDHVDGIQLATQFSEDVREARSLLAKTLFQDQEQSEIAARILGYLRATNDEAAYAVCSLLLHLSDDADDCSVLVAADVHELLVLVIQSGTRVTSVQQRAALVLRNMLVIPEVQQVLAERLAGVTLNNRGWLKDLVSRVQ